MTAVRSPSAYVLTPFVALTVFRAAIVPLPVDLDGSVTADVVVVVVAVAWRTFVALSPDRVFVLRHAMQRRSVLPAVWN